jgi:maltose O-acetyltransferase
MDLTSNICNELLFNYSELNEEEIISKASVLHKKIIRWLGIHHPDNKTRKIFYSLTNVAIGKDTVVNQNFIVSDNYSPLLTIGERVAIAPNVTVICVSNPNNSQLQNHPYVIDKLISEKPVIIEDDVWIGANVVILPGVTLSKGSIIGAGSVVTSSTDPMTVYAGVPAKKVRELSR